VADISSTPTVTVVVPTYNSSGTLRLALATVLRQDFEDFEVWVVGDGCTDDSEAIVASLDDRRVHWVNLAQNSGGPAEPRNQALGRARGRLIAYLGHDDLWFPWQLSELVHHIEHGGYEFVCSRGVTLGPQGIVDAFTLPSQAWDLNSGISPSNWMHRRSLAEVVGPWSTHLRTGHDRDYLQRILDAGVSVGQSHRLSVIVFASGLWGMYSLSGDPPQSPYAEEMRDGAGDLQTDLLAQLSAVKSSHAESSRHLRTHLETLPKQLARRVIAAIAPSRWPANLLLYHYWRRRSGLPHRRGSPD
jgi:glycosyltransferase involved in cell wall biosynthesis